MKVYQLLNELSLNSEQNNEVIFTIDGKEYTLQNVNSVGRTCEVELAEVLKTERQTITQHKTLRLDSCTCLYRGKEIELREHISAGYGGRYRVGKHSFTSQKEAKKWIDKLCSDKGIDSFMTIIEAKQYKLDYYS